LFDSLFNKATAHVALFDEKANLKQLPTQVDIRMIFEILLAEIVQVLNFEEN
jgi:hypothetical protein